jgi:hypothetical protein
MLADAGRTEEARGELAALREILHVTRFHSDRVREMMDRELLACERAVDEGEGSTEVRAEALKRPADSSSV